MIPESKSSDLELNKVDYSFAITVYMRDNPSHFQIALNSLANQTKKPYDISLVVDGKVSDELKAIISEFKVYCVNKRIIFNCIYLPSNIGRGLARNIAIANSKCEIVALMDADDYSLPHRAINQLEYLYNHSEIALVSSFGIENYNNEITVIGSNFNIKTSPSDHSNIAKALQISCPIINPSIMFYKTAWSYVGGYPDFKLTSEDQLYFLRLVSSNFKLACIQKPLVHIRVTPSMLKRRVGIKIWWSDIVFRFTALSESLISTNSFLFGILASTIRRLLPYSFGYRLTLFARKFLSKNIN